MQRIVVSLSLVAFLLCGCAQEPQEHKVVTHRTNHASSESPVAAPVDTAAASMGTPAVPAAPATSAVATPLWPRFHGPDATNVSPDTGLMRQWPKDGPPLLWTVEGIGGGFASVTLAEGMIFTSGNIGENTIVTALGLDGDLRWQAENGPAWTSQYEGTRGTPTFAAGRVYHESPLGRVACLDAHTGKALWHVDLFDRFGAENIQWALAESVLVDGPRVICAPGGENVSLVALDAETGETVWKAPTSGDKAGYASPVLFEQDGLRIIATMTAKALVGVDADTGAILFRHEHITSYDVNATMPMYHAGHLFITSGYGSGSEMLKVTVAGKTAKVASVWTSKDLDNKHGGVVLLDGYLYGAADSAHGGGWICLDWKTGRQAYAERGVGKGSLTAADGMLYTLSERRDVGLVPATPQAHNVVSEFRMPSGGEGPSWAHPVVAGGRLYLRHADKLFAYDVRAR